MTLAGFFFFGDIMNLTHQPKSNIVSQYEVKYLLPCCRSKDERPQINGKAHKSFPHETENFSDKSEHGLQNGTHKTSHNGQHSNTHTHTHTNEASGQNLKKEPGGNQEAEIERMKQKIAEAEANVAALKVKFSYLPFSFSQNKDSNL